uniref:Uncharacterized protein n=1 Tax=Angiostrongylus cantonensis TaxID=6313 RepID=A0A0K0DAH3_ANGCA
MTRVARVTIALRRDRRLRQRKHGDDDGDGADRPSATRRRKHPPVTPFVRLPRDTAEVATLSSLSTASPPVHHGRHPLPTDIIDSYHVITIVPTRKVRSRNGFTAAGQRNSISGLPYTLNKNFYKSNNYARLTSAEQTHSSASIGSSLVCITTMQARIFELA